MTLDFAIQYCREKAMSDCRPAAHFRQLAEWLDELKQRRTSVCENCSNWIPGFEIKDDFTPPMCQLRSGVWHCDDYCSDFTSHK